ncbi:MAG: hypothetical protein HYY18_06060 [Planctomycetes bacterium]|nr:hypothetical protein [Planctomycetota bacterium]
MERLLPADLPGSPLLARFSFTSILAGISCAALPLVLCAYGYGAYLRAAWFIAIPALIGLSFVALYSLRIVRNLATGQLRTGAMTAKFDKALILVFLGLFILSWISGRQIRTWHCESICARVEPALEALRRYHEVHGCYPARLQEVPEFTRLADIGKVSIQEGRILSTGLDVGSLEESDMTIYLEPQYYFCVVPLEKKLLMSITRFYILSRDSTSSDWTEDHMIWMLSAP